MKKYVLQGQHIEYQESSIVVFSDDFPKNYSRRVRVFPVLTSCDCADCKVFSLGLGRK